MIVQVTDDEGKVSIYNDVAAIGILCLDEIRNVGELRGYHLTDKQINEVVNLVKYCDEFPHEDDIVSAIEHIIKGE